MADRIELWPADRLQPYAKNARTHSDDQVDQIAASIREFGFTNPILVDSADGIIAGHGRLMASKRLGLATVPVIVLDHLTDAQRRAYILADNKLALNAGWDNELLAQELKKAKTPLEQIDVIRSFLQLSPNALALNISSSGTGGTGTGGTGTGGTGTYTVGPVGSGAPNSMVSPDTTAISPGPPPL